MLDVQDRIEAPLRSPEPLLRGGRIQQASAVGLVCLPLAGVIYAVIRLWHHGIGWLDLSLAVGMYLITGHGMTVGFHRMLTHGSFRPARPLKIALAIAGSMAIEGSVYTWVAMHRRHHAYADRVGDPHSPWLYGTGGWSQMRGLWHAHLGWFFASNPSEPERWIGDLLEDKDLDFVSRTAPLWSVMSLLLPFLIGLAVTRTFVGGLLALLWGGAVRLAVLHHVTWGVNSFTHMFGKRPFRNRDRSSNLAVLGVLGFGEGWHNAHHAYPMLARHGVDRWQFDSSALLIRLFERLGWVSNVQWPDAAKLAVRRRA